MITKFKIYENINPELGDYVICNILPSSSEKLEQQLATYINNNLGQFVKYNVSVIFEYHIKYENIPSDFKDFFINDKTIGVERTEIKYWSKNKADCEAYLAANKYNI